MMDRRPKETDEDFILYIVYLEPDTACLDNWAWHVRLAKGLHLIRSTETRSRVYHSVKARAAPSRLLVAPLQEAPKFKGMDPGALRNMQRLLEAPSS